jgi:hypothetical protein
MELHWRFHHGAQVNGLNTALAGQEALARMPLDELLMNLSRVPENIRGAIRNNGGGHANHSMFWEIMGGRGGEPTGEVLEAINRDLGGSFGEFRNRFNAASMGVLRLRLGLRDRGALGPARHRHAAEPGQPADGRPARADGQRPVGARLLPALPEPPRRIREQLVERDELGQGGRAPEGGARGHAAV